MVLFGRLLRFRGWSLLRLECSCGRGALAAHHVWAISAGCFLDTSKAIAGRVHFEDHAVMHQVINDCRGRHRVVEDGA